MEWWVGEVGGGLVKTGDRETSRAAGKKDRQVESDRHYYFMLTRRLCLICYFYIIIIAFPKLMDQNDRENRRCVLYCKVFIRSTPKVQQQWIICNQSLGCVAPQCEWGFFHTVVKARAMEIVFHICCTRGHSLLFYPVSFLQEHVLGSVWFFLLIAHKSWNSPTEIILLVRLCLLRKIISALMLNTRLHSTASEQFGWVFLRQFHLLNYTVPGSGLNVCTFSMKTLSVFNPINH